MDGAIDELVSAYAKAAATYGLAERDGTSDEANQAARVIAEVYAELRRRGEAAQHALLALLEHADPAVRGWAGAHALDFAPEHGESVLTALSQEYDDVVGFNAEMTLQVWRAGELRFP